MNHFRFTLFICIVWYLILPFTAVQASNNDNPPPLPGWTHSPAFSVDTPQRHGIVLSGSLVVRSSPVIAEIDGNAQNGKEVAVSGTDGMLYVYGSEGGLRWSVNVLPAACSVGAVDTKIGSTPAVGQILGNGVSYVVIGYGSINASDCDGGIAAYDGRSGKIAWRFSLRTWAQQQGYSENLYGVVSSPALADTDSDGKMEIGFGGFDRHVYLLNAEGTARWSYHSADTVWSSPAFVDINGDQRLEMIIGTDISENAFYKISNGGYLYAFDTKQRPANSLRVDFQPSTLSSPVLWRTFFDQTIYSTPAIGDILPANSGMEIAIGSGGFFPAGSTNKTGKWVKIARLGDGAVIQTLNTNADSVGSTPALGDIDGDGKLEVVATVGDLLDTATNIGKIIAWDPDASVNPKWETTPYNPISPPNDLQGNDEDGGSMQSAVIADLDGNGSLEVIAANNWSLHVLNGSDGAPLTCQSNQCGSQLSLFTWGTLKSTPAVGDVNGDGKLEVIIGGMHANNGGKGMLYSWTSFADLLKSPQGNQSPYSAPWPMFRGNARHTGIYPTLKPSSSTAGFIIKPNQAATQTLTFADAEGNGITWSVTKDDPNNTLILNRTSGASSDPLIVTVNSQTMIAALGIGKYTANLTVQSPGLSNMTIPFNIIVTDQIYTVLSPMIIR